MKSAQPEPAAVNRARFYVTGGALALTDASYVPRRADDELLAALQAGEFCHVLTSRQRGKSSLMIRTAHTLRAAGGRVVLLDLTRIGQNVSAEQWYLGLLDLLGESLEVQAELEVFWDRHKDTGPMQRWFNALTQAALPATPSPLVVFVDEIDAVGSLPFSTDEFFAAIRECYNRRPQDPALNQLTFCLLGVASAADLIRDPRATPFNIGRRIVLTDFTAAEARRLGAGLSSDPRLQASLIQRVLFWTSGHPYLTQRLCAAIAHHAATTAAEVDRLCHELFLGSDARKREDNLLFVAQQLLRSPLDRAALLEAYRRVRRGRKVRDSEADPLIEALRLSGITRSHEGRLLVRNRIYAAVFDEAWISQNLPAAEVRRQQAAFHEGLRGGLMLALVVVAIITGLMLWENHHASVRESQRLGAVYDHLQTYRDASSIKLECDPLSIGIDSQFAFARPNKFHLDASLKIIFGEFRVESFCDGQRLWVYIPALRQYIEEAAPPDLLAFVEKNARIEPMFEGFRQTLRGYMELFSTNGAETLHASAGPVRLAASGEYQGQPVHQFEWRARSRLRVPQGYGLFQEHETTFPNTLWVRNRDGIFVKSVTDLSDLRSALTGDQVQILKFSGSNMVATVEHHDIQLNPELSPGSFSFQPPPGTERVSRLDFTKVFPLFLGPTKPLFPPGT